LSSDTRAHLSDIVDNSERIADYISTQSQEQFERDERTRDAVERCLQRICEAAVRLGDKAEQVLPGHPWNEIRGMGNWLRHGYDRLDPTIVWDVVTRDLPGLFSDAQSALRGMPD
jgi:uncharacterized protein with HEPN domain